MNLFFLLFLLLIIGLTGSEFIFTLFNAATTWHGAKSNCEMLGQRLVVLDTVEKEAALKAQM